MLETITALLLRYVGSRKMARSLAAEVIAAFNEQKTTCVAPHGRTPTGGQPGCTPD